MVKGGRQQVREDDGAKAAAAAIVEHVVYAQVLAAEELRGEHDQVWPRCAECDARHHSGSDLGVGAG